MKTINYVLFFMIIILSSVVILNIRTQELSTITQRNIAYNQAVDEAVDEAVAGMVEVADKSKLQLNYKECVNNFYSSLYAAFGALDNEVLQNDLKLYTPVIALTSDDGVFIVYNSINSSGKLVKVWSDMIPFQKTFTLKGSEGLGTPVKYTIVFSLDDDVIVKFSDDNRIYSGTYRDLLIRYPGTKMSDYFGRTILAEDGTFNNWRHEVITSTIEQQMNYYARYNNDIAKSFGITYNFSLPESSTGDLANSVDNVGMMVLFQGYPYGKGLRERFNKFCVGGAQITKNSSVYVRKGNDNRYYYHVSDCNEDITNESTVYDSAYTAALDGALPCPECSQ